MYLRRFVIVFCSLVIGAFSFPAPTLARVIHFGTLSLEVPDSWKAREDTVSRLSGEYEERLGSWEAFIGGESRGYLTTGVLKQSSLIAPVGAPLTRREIESRLRALSSARSVGVSEFETVAIDGVPAYRARYTLETREGDLLDQRLYILGGSETSILAFTQTQMSSESSGRDVSFDEIMERARVRSRHLGLTPQSSLGILTIVASLSLLGHAARGSRGRGRQGVEAR